MFKRKLYKAAVAALSFIFMAATPGNRIPQPYAGEACRPDGKDSLTHLVHAFDTTGLCTCLPELTSDEMANAPRIGLHKQAAGFVKEFNSKNDFYLDKIKDRSEPYFTLIDSIFTRYEVPVELKYLAVIESKLENKAVSGAGAAGLWQLMPVAAKSFGLKVGGKNDERLNNRKSTEAAAKCLLYLHGMFDDWLLTLAAYNSGPGRVLSAIKKSGSRNFWDLQQFLPEETRKHVKKFIAMHYYFEGHGSLVTLTKAETKAHVDAVTDFVKRQQQVKNDSLAVNPETVAR